MSMENIRTRADFGGAGGNNYLVRGIRAMVRKAEDNKGRVQFWATIVLTVSMAFVPWLKDEFIEKGRQQVRQENAAKETEELRKALKAKEEEVEALKKQQPLQAQPTVAPPPKRRPPHQAGAKRQLNGQGSTLRAAPQLRVEKISGGKKL